MSLVHNHVALPALTFSYDVGKASWTWAAGLRELHGLGSSEEPTTEEFLARMHQGDRVVMISRFQHHLEHAGPYACSYRMRDASGHQRRLIFVGQSEAVAGVVKRLSGFVVDITEPAREFGREAVAASALHRSTVEQAKGALMLAFKVDDGGAAGLLQAYASRHRLTTLAVATVIVKQLADPRRDASDPSGAMESIVASLAQQPDTGATAVT
ncbi:MAG: PAS and ANTAR domain-containing protein [Pedococcus sp.]